MQTTRGASLSDAKEPNDGAAGPVRDRPRRVAVVMVAQLSDRPPIRLFGGLLTLLVTRNSGAAFSIGTGVTFVFTLIAASVVVAILRTARNLRSLPWAVVLGLLLGGAMGNLVDRLFRSPGRFAGHVVDWIELPHWPVFNLADSAIVCGGAIAVLLAAKGLQIDGTRAADAGTGRTPEEETADAGTDAPTPAEEPDAPTKPEGKA